MAKFHFRLATLLRLRETTRDRRRVQLAETIQADANLRNRLTRIDAGRRRLQGECRRAAGPGAVDVVKLAEAHRHDATLQEQQAELLRQRETLAAEIERRRQTLLTADRDVRVMEKLHDHRQRQHRQNEERREAKQLDEAALQVVER